MMRDLWQETLRPFSPNPTVAEAMFVKLTARYEENGRFYHTLAHIQQMFALLAEVENETTIPKKSAISLAIWFHDVIYDPNAKDNEAQSAAYAKRMLNQLSMPASLIQHVEHLILATGRHEAPKDDFSCQLLLDIDLAILGALPAEYANYAAAIRQEYAHVPDVLYRQGRTAVLQHLLQRNPLYFTPLLHRRLATQARHNLIQEIEQMQQNS